MLNKVSTTGIVLFSFRPHFRADHSPRCSAWCTPCSVSCHAGRRSHRQRSRFDWPHPARDLEPRSKRASTRNQSGQGNSRKRNLRLPEIVVVTKKSTGGLTWYVLVSASGSVRQPRATSHENQGTKGASWRRVTGILLPQYPSIINPPESPILHLSTFESTGTQSNTIPSNCQSIHWQTRRSTEVATKQLRSLLSDMVYYA